METKNHAEQLAFQAEKVLQDHGDKISEDLKKDIEGKITAVRDAVKAEDTDAIKTSHSALEAALSKVGEAVYAQSAQQTPAVESGESTPPSGNDGGDDVVDAEFKEV